MRSVWKATRRVYSRSFDSSNATSTVSDVVMLTAITWTPAEIAQGTKKYAVSTAPDSAATRIGSNVVEASRKSCPT